MKQTQKKWVIQQLKEKGEITRNQCLQNYISRLGAIVCVLKDEGWKLEPFSREGDYVYKVIEAPKRVVYEYDIVDGVAHPRKTFIPI